MLNIHIKEKFHCMKKRRILGMIITICLLLEGCVSDNDDPGVFRQEETVTESALEGGVSGKGVEQKAGDAEREGSAEETSWTGSSYMTAYQRFLEAYVEENEYANMARAMLALIDDDTVPELLLIEDNSHASGVKVYKYYQESVVELGEFGSFGSMQYVERGGMIFSGYSGMGEGYAGFFRVEEGEAELLCSIRDYEPFDGSPKTYEIDGVSATEEAYNKKWEELYDTYKYMLITYEDAFAIQELEIADLLAEAQNALLLQKEFPRLAEMVEEQSKVLEGYKVFLADYIPQRTANNSVEIPAFSLIYLDGDDVPELIVIEGYAHACGGYVYTFEEGKIVPIGENYGGGYGQYGAMRYWEKEGIVFGDYDQGGNVYCDVYQIEGSKDTLLQSYSVRCEFTEEGEEPIHTYTVDGKAVSKGQFREVYDKWDEIEGKMIQYGDCRTLTDGDIRSALTEELENLILMQEEVLKQNVLIAAGAQESNILLWDYDDYDGDGDCEAFMIVGNILDARDESVYNNESLWFVGADGRTLALDNRGLRAIDGKMDFGSRKYLFFYLDYNLTANISVIWTVRDGKPVEESELYQSGEVIYRGENERNEFEIWVDAYDSECDIDDDLELWIGHTWKPYFYHYDPDRDQIEKYGGEIISGEAFGKLSGTNLIEEIDAEGYIVGDIIRWDNDIVTINYERHNDLSGSTYYKNVIWDNNVKDFWQKDVRGVTSWRDAGVGGSYRL